MKYNKTATLYGGQSCLLRNAVPGDAEDILRLLVQASEETTFLARYGDEIKMTAEQEAEYLSALADSPRACMIAAYVGGTLTANSGINPVSGYERHRLRAEFGISVKKDYWGMGIGSALVEANIETAKAAGYKQLELEVVADNARAIALYEKYGFQIYGTRPHTFAYRDGSFASAHLMLLEL
jgi:ribosomal protein S18 acetylase RimI-like enzyme